jgi:hypothetical protein
MARQDIGGGQWSERPKAFCGVVPRSRCGRGCHESLGLSSGSWGTSLGWRGGRAARARRRRRGLGWATRMHAEDCREGVICSMWRSREGLSSSKAIHAPIPPAVSQDYAPHGGLELFGFPLGIIRIPQIRQTRGLWGQQRNKAGGQLLLQGIQLPFLFACQENRAACRLNDIPKDLCCSSVLLHYLIRGHPRSPVAMTAAAQQSV